MSKSELERYDCIPYMTSDFPPTIMLGSEYRHDMNVMHDQLDAVDVENVLIDPLAEKGEEKQHCFVAAERVDATAKEAFDRLITFVDGKIK